MKSKTPRFCLVLVLVITGCNRYEEILKPPLKNEGALSAENSTLFAARLSDAISGYDNLILSGQPVAFGMRSPEMIWQTGTPV